jgi:penicillin-binding protein 1C
LTPPSRQLVWYVDGRPFALADYPYGTRWPLASGRHTIQARVPFNGAASAPVQITVE